MEVIKCEKKYNIRFAYFVIGMYAKIKLSQSGQK